MNTLADTDYSLIFIYKIIDSINSLPLKLCSQFTEIFLSSYCMLLAGAGATGVKKSQTLPSQPLHSRDSTRGDSRELRMELLWFFKTSTFTGEGALLWLTGPLWSNAIPAAKQWVIRSLRVSHSVLCEVDSRTFECIQMCTPI